MKRCGARAGGRIRTGSAADQDRVSTASDLGQARIGPGSGPERTWVRPGSATDGAGLPAQVDVVSHHQRDTRATPDSG
ncbi:hypothetical protein GCM10010385_60020 [Streptomyces geysiriensis]|nr:hypothetical protein GCM10010385_60020 [Streptomyces geysiriensis]